MKRVILVVVLALVFVLAVGAWLLLGSATAFSENRKFLYVYTGRTSEKIVMDSVRERGLLKYPGFFDFVADKMGVWTKLRAGRFEIKKGESLLSVARMLRNNRQTAVNLVINKLRTKDDLVSALSRNFEADSTEFLDFVNNDDSLRLLGVNNYTLMTLVVPNTYTLYWTTTPGKILKRLKSEQENFWDKNGRKAKARTLGFTPEQVYTIASIVEEETNKLDEKGNIASVYINRYRSGMKLGADPTVKFALNNFALKRIYEKYLGVESPYNTYKYPGLPPGPICTPSSKTIDAVLNSPRTDYMYFVARKDFSGYHTFSSNYAEHLQHAHEYQKALDEWLLKKQNAAKPAL